MIKKILLFFLCMSLFLSIADCKKKLPTSPDFPELESEIQAPIIIFSADRSELLYGSSTQLRWSIQNVTRAEMNIINLETNEQQNLGEIGSQGDMEITPKARTAYTINAWNQDKTASKSIEINVRSGANLRRTRGDGNIILRRIEDPPNPTRYRFDWDITLKNIGNLATTKIRIDVHFMDYVGTGAVIHFYFYDPLMPDEQRYFEGSCRISDYQYEWWLTFPNWLDVNWEPTT